MIRQVYWPIYYPGCQMCSSENSQGWGCDSSVMLFGCMVVTPSICTLAVWFWHCFILFFWKLHRVSILLQKHLNSGPVELASFTNTKKYIENYAWLAHTEQPWVKFSSSEFFQLFLWQKALIYSHILQIPMFTFFVY